MSRIPPVDLERVEPALRKIFEAQRQRWGAPLLSHLVHARRPMIYRGVRAMWSGLDESGLVEPALVAMVNRRVAYHNGCVF